MGSRHEEIRIEIASALRTVRRASNEARRGLLDQLRCECARPDCRATVPAAAHAHRTGSEGFIVIPGHADADSVTAVSDRFFIVEASR